MRISDWSSDVCSSDLAGSQPSVGHDLAGHDADSAGASHQSGRGSGDYGRSRLRFLQHLRPAAEARPVSNTAVLENALLPLRPILAREDVTALVINKAGEAAIETRNGWSWETLPELNEKSLLDLARAAAAMSPQDISQ